MLQAEPEGDGCTLPVYWPTMASLENGQRKGVYISTPLVSKCISANSVIQRSAAVPAVSHFPVAVWSLVWRLCTAGDRVRYATAELEPATCIFFLLLFHEVP